jgi:hypothetical protein
LAHVGDNINAHFVTKGSSDIDIIRDDTAHESNKISELTPINFMEDYVAAMTEIRKEANHYGLIPVYHYTSIDCALLILKTGFRYSCSDHNSNSGGIHFTTLGPCSYGVHTKQYETNIIKDCFGVERLRELKGKGLMDAVVVYGVAAGILEQV